MPQIDPSREVSIEEPIFRQYHNQKETFPIGRQGNNSHQSTEKRTKTDPTGSQPDHLVTHQARRKRWEMTELDAKKKQKARKQKQKGKSKTKSKNHPNGKGAGKEQ